MTRPPAARSSGATGGQRPRKKPRAPEGRSRRTTPTIVLVVSAASGAGKTTLLERLIPLLVKSGLRVGAVKRSHHDVELDPPGKDSRRLRDAGASPVILRGPHVTTVFGATQAGNEMETLLAAAQAFGPLHVLLVEGGRSVPFLPRIEIVAPGGRVVSDPASLLAVLADDRVTAGVPAGVPCFRRDDVEALAALLLAR